MLAELCPPSLMLWPRAACPSRWLLTPAVPLAPAWGEAAAPLQSLRPPHGLWGSHSTGRASSCGRYTQGSGQGDSPSLGTLGQA